MFDPNTGQNLDLNVSLAHPWSKDIRRASRENGYATMARQDNKKIKKKFVPGGHVLRCLSLVIEHFGRWGTNVENFLQHLSQQSGNLEANFNGSTFDVLKENTFNNPRKIQCQSCHQKSFKIIMVI